MRRPTSRRLLHYARTCLRLGSYLDVPGDGRHRPRIPAHALLWALLILKILRTASLHGTEMLVRQARTSLGVGVEFSDDTLAYFLERLAPERTRQALIELLRRAKRNKVFGASSVSASRWMGRGPAARPATPARSVIPIATRRTTWSVMAITSCWPAWSVPASCCPSMWSRSHPGRTS